MKKVIRRFLVSILRSLRSYLDEETKKYATDDIKWNNVSIIDGLIPQFVKIGRNFVSGPNSIILSHDASYFFLTSKYKVKPVEIGDDVFLGAGAIVLPGVRVGNRVVIGAGSIVTKDVPEGVVVAGNPAIFICTTDELIQKADAEQVLYIAPYTIEDIIRQKGLLTSAQTDSFQKSAVNEYRRRNPDTNNWIEYKG